MQSEIWKPISEYNGYYEVSNKGRVRSVTRKIERTDPHNPNKKRLFTYKGKLVKFWITKKGYLRCTLCINSVSKKHLIHRLVAKEFIKNPEGKKQINHKNCVKSDNNVDNLEWCSNYENWLHSAKNGKQDNSHKTNGVRNMSSYK
jgi:hypothetical protein